MKFLQGKCQLILEELSQRMEKAVAQLHFEEAALLRDQIKSLRLVQEQQSVVQLRGDADVIAIETSPGFACIQCATIREGQVIASNSYFPTVPTHSFNDELEVEHLWGQTFTAFIGFYYLDNPERIPECIITNHTVENKNILEQALTQRRGKPCKIQVNPRGIKSRWVDFAENNLRISIAEFVTKHSTIKARYQALEEVLSLPQKIVRMECFDISHTQGEATIASCVVFNDEGPRPSEYRRFNITGITPGDDYAAMEQVLTRRFKRLVEEQSLPDLLIIDGGKGQVGIAQNVLNRLNITEVLILGIAKGPSRKAGWERFILVNESREFTLPEDSKASHLLQHIRDEAHRFAITAHRKKRQKARSQSTLEEIEGVGAKRRQALLQRFGGIRELAKASLDELSKVPGINANLAERIYQYFHE
jgi:excinuclease ABC subunit C